MCKDVSHWLCLLWSSLRLLIKNGLVYVYVLSVFHNGVINTVQYSTKFPYLTFSITGNNLEKIICNMTGLEYQSYSVYTKSVSLVHAILRPPVETDAETFTSRKVVKLTTFCFQWVLTVNYSIHAAYCSIDSVLIRFLLILTYWGRGKMADISMTMFSNLISYMKIGVFVWNFTEICSQ